MRILVVSATPLEIEPLVGRLRHVSDTGLRSVSYRSGDHDVDVLTTGVGHGRDGRVVFPCVCGGAL